MLTGAAALCHSLGPGALTPDVARPAGFSLHAHAFAIKLRDPDYTGAIPASRSIFPESDRLMPSVRVKENEPFEVALRRFKRSCEKAGVVTEVRRREHFEKPCQERKRKRAAAVKRQLKRVQREQQRFTRQY